MHVRSAATHNITQEIVQARYRYRNALAFTEHVGFAARERVQSVTHSRHQQLQASRVTRTDRKSEYSIGRRDKTVVH